MAKWVEQLIRN